MGRSKSAQHLYQNSGDLVGERSPRKSQAYRHWAVGSVVVGIVQSDSGCYERAEYALGITAKATYKSNGGHPYLMDLRAFV